MPKLRDEIKLKIILKPFKTKGARRTVGYYMDKNRTSKVIEVDTRENISDMISIIYHEITHLVVTYFALDEKCIEKIKETMGKEEQYRFKKVTGNQEEKICNKIGRQAKDIFRENLEKA